MDYVGYHAVWEMGFDFDSQSSLNHFVGHFSSLDRKSVV